MAEETTATTQNSGEETTATSLLSSSETETTTTSTSTVAEAATEQTAQTDADAAAAAEKAKTEAAAKVGAPEKYEFTMPEGITLDEAAVKAFEPVARELNLTNDQAQKLVNIQADFVERQAKAQSEAWASQVKAWQDEVRADKEIGGQNFDSSINAAKAVLKRFDSDATIIKALDQTGVSNHPALVRLLVKVGKAMAEDTFKSGSNAAKADPIKSLYTNSQMN